MINSPLHSKVHRSDAELQEAHKKLKAIKYPVPALSHAMYLNKKMKSINRKKWTFKIEQGSFF